MKKRQSHTDYSNRMESCMLFMQSQLDIRYQDHSKTGRIAYTAYRQAIVDMGFGITSYADGTHRILQRKRSYTRKDKNKE